MKTRRIGRCDQTDIEGRGSAGSERQGADHRQRTQRGLDDRQTDNDGGDVTITFHAASPRSYPGVMQWAKVMQLPYRSSSHM